MAFQFSEQHIADYMGRGYTVFRGILPATLLADLRKVSARARELARAEKGPQAQRIQPISDYELDPMPFKDYAELPELNDALRQVISPEVWHGDLDTLAILLEPQDRPWTTGWHRDITAESRGVDPVEFEAIRYDHRRFNQVNCALYDDSSTWYVPGSHCRDDVAGETALIAARPGATLNRSEDSGHTQEQLEVEYLDYCRAMPRGVCLHLSAGDFALYRALGWHLGNYAPYRKRATLHDIVWTPLSRAWHHEWARRLDEASAEPTSNLPS